MVRLFTNAASDSLLAKRVRTVSKLAHSVSEMRVSLPRVGEICCHTCQHQSTVLKSCCAKSIFVLKSTAAKNATDTTGKCYSFLAIVVTFKIIDICESEMDGFLVNT